MFLASGGLASAHSYTVKTETIKECFGPCSQEPGYKKASKTYRKYWKAVPKGYWKNGVYCLASSPCHAHKTEISQGQPSHGCSCSGAQLEAPTSETCAPLPAEKVRYLTHLTLNWLSQNYQLAREHTLGLT